MVTIRYSLTPEDLAEIEEVRRGGLLSRIVRIPAAALVGLMGLAIAWPALFLFPWHPWDHWFGNLAIAGVGLFIVWVGLEMPGLRWLMQRVSDPYAEQEVRIYEGKLVSSCQGKTQQFRWFPQRGFQQSRKFFFLRAFDAKLAIPKRSVTPDQERGLLELVRQESVQHESDRAAGVECSFFLTETELNEAAGARQPRVLQRWFSTKHGRALSRVVCGLGALWFLWLPGHLGTSWAKEFRNEPRVSAVLIGFGILGVWSAAGCPGAKGVSRLDLERRIRVGDLNVEVIRGTKSSNYRWTRFFSYQETENLFLLRTRVMLQFLTIPKRALRPGDEEKLRSLLDRKLPQE